MLHKPKSKCTASTRVRPGQARSNDLGLKTFEEAGQLKANHVVPTRTLSSLRLLSPVCDLSFSA
eukprot:3695401-Amphidinium_carterae.1